MKLQWPISLRSSDGDTETAALVGPDGLRGKSIDDIIEALDQSGFGATKAGTKVTTNTSLQVTAVLACVRVIAEGIAQLPLKVYRENENGGKDVAKDHSVHRLLRRRPNEWMTSFELREALTMHAALSGDGFAIKNMTSDGRVGELLPVMPNHMKVEQLPNYDLVYDVTIDGRHIGRFPRERIFHLRGPSWNTISGLSPVKLAREAVGLAMATEESQSRLHSNGGRIGGVLSAEGQLKPEQIKQIAEAWKKAHGGVENSFKVAVLDGGLSFQKMTVDAVDAQMVETRKHQIEEIARAFRVFPQMIGHSDKAATYASAEQFFLAHVIHSLGPWIARWEQALDRDLLSDPADDDYFTQFSVEGLLRGASKDRAEFYNKMVMMGAFTRNEVRKLENLDPIPGLDEPLTPMNMTMGEGADNDET